MKKKEGRESLGQLVYQEGGGREGVLGEGGESLFYKSRGSMSKGVIQGLLRPPAVRFVGRIRVKCSLKSQRQIGEGTETKSLRLG